MSELLIRIQRFLRWLSDDMDNDQLLEARDMAGELDVLIDQELKKLEEDDDQIKGREGT